MLSYTQQLENIQVSIQKIESGATQSVSIMGRSVTYQNLSLLYDREKWLMSKISREKKGGGITTFTILPHRN